MTDIKLLILFFIVNSLEIFGFYYACKESSDEHSDDEILWWIHALCRIYLGEKWTKPICGCVICMASVHSLVVWIPIYIIMPFTFSLIYVHAIYICALAGWNNLITSLKFVEL